MASRIEEAALVLAGGLDVALHPALVVWFSLENGTISGWGIGKETSGNTSIRPMPTWPPTIYTPVDGLTESLVLSSTLSSHEGCSQGRTTFFLLPVSSSLSQSATTPPSHAHGGRGEEQTTTTHGQSTPAAYHPALDSVTHPAAGMFARPRMS